MNIKEAFGIIEGLAMDSDMESVQIGGCFRTISDACDTIRKELFGSEKPSHNKQSEEIKCNNCGIVLPPMEPGEGEPSKSGYLCRKCFGLD